MSGRAFVIGAGLAGLVAAERLSAAGREVILFEASPKAGGRCRSYRDARLGEVIDNGNHLILSCNRAVLDWAERIGGADALETGEASYPFLDLATGAGWTLRPGRGPLGALAAEARPPGATLGRLSRDLLRLLVATPSATVEEVIGRGPAWAGFWDPMTRAVLNEDPGRASASLLRAALLRSFGRGAHASMPVFAPRGLGIALVDPAVELLTRRGVGLRLRTPVTGLVGQGHLKALMAGDETVAVGPRDAVILATPVSATAALLPGVSLPAAGHAILNAHFLVPNSRLPPILALLGGTAHWVFRRGNTVSVTVSALEASGLAGLARETMLGRLWDDVRAAVRAHGGHLPVGMPPARLLRERAATFDQSPAGVSRRLGPRTAWPNLFLAGDHVATGLPATLEGAVRSGLRAADLALPVA